MGNITLTTTTSCVILEEHSPSGGLRAFVRMAFRFFFFFFFTLKHWPWSQSCQSLTRISLFRREELLSKLKHFFILFIYLFKIEMLV